MKKMLILLAVILLLTPKVSAQSIGDGVDIALGVVPERISQSLEDNAGLSVTELIKSPPSKIFDLMLAEAKDSIKAIASTLSMIVGIILLITVVQSLSTGIEGTTENILQLAGCLWIIFVLSDNMARCILEGIAAILDCTRFMMSYIPVYSGVAAAAGLPASSLIYHSTIIGAGQIISQITQNILSPLIGVFLSISVAGVISENKGLMNVSTAIKKTVIWMLTLMMTIFVGLVTMQSFIAGVTDLSVSKTAKFLVGSFVPVVGSVISDAVSVAKNSMGMIKATVGSIGIVVTLLFFLPILVKITLWRAAIFLGTLIGDIMGVEYSGKVLSAFNDTLVILTAIILSVALLFVISTGVILSLGVV